MFPLCSFLQSACQLVKMLAASAAGVAKRMYRSSAVILWGTAAVVVMTFTSAGFSGSRSTLTAYAETLAAQVKLDGEKETEEIEVFTEAKMQLHLTDSESLKSGQRFVGNSLAENIQDELVMQKARRAASEEAKEETRKIEEERQRIEAERAGEEARRAAAVIAYSDQDYELLTQIVEAEAGSCDIRGRILVANVVINRVNSGRFPNTIHDVVYQKSQFSPVYDGRLFTCRVTQQTVEAVDRALAGEDYSQGALFFMNRGRSSARNVSWFDNNLTFLFQHDRHEFFK